MSTRRQSAAAGVAFVGSREVARGQGAVSPRLGAQVDGTRSPLPYASIVARRWTRILVALLCFSAIVTEIVTLIQRGHFVAANFFSFFTIESNLFACTVLLASAIAPVSSRRLDLFRGASTVFMVTVFVVFAVLLAGLDASVLTAVPWDNTVLHQIVPAAVLVDWLLEPPAERIGLRDAVVWLVVPIVYLTYSLARGAWVGWYPYPFLDPGHEGYVRVAMVSLAIALFVMTVTWLVTRVQPRGTPTQGLDAGTDLSSEHRPISGGAGTV